jgi:hypothetical protein
MAFEKHAAQEEPVSAGAWEKKQKRRTDMDKADSVKRTSTYAVTDDAEKSKPAGVVMAPQLNSLLCPRSVSIKPKPVIP